MPRSDKGKRCDENGAVVTIVQTKGEWNEMDDTKNDCFALVTLCLFDGMLPFSLIQLKYRQLCFEPTF